MTRPCWLRRAVRNRHRHVIEQASRRWRGGRRDDSARDGCSMARRLARAESVGASRPRNHDAGPAPSASINTFFPAVHACVEINQ